VEVGSYIWFIGLGGGIAVLGLIIAYGLGRGRPPKAAGDANHAWKQAAAESGHPEVARPPAPDVEPRSR
jgi:hypothetical protein